MELQKARDFDYTKIAPFVALAVLIAVSAVMSEHFLKPQNLLNVLRQVSFTGVIALGMTFVIIGGGIDLSVGSAVAFAGAIGLMAMNSVGDGVLAVLAGIGAAVGVGSACGAFNGILVAKGRVAPFIATLGTMSIFRSLTLHICQAGEVRANNALFQKLGAGTFLWVPVPAWAFLILAVLFH
ncbi:MAG: ABC transporter permease, partial [Planctomycetes bacterium]|nr:ABC transporter permease [Planctomycetota bacterium]